MNNDDDYIVDDLSIVKKKKINCGRKGKSGERDLCKILEGRFAGKIFHRTIGSGNRYSQVTLTEQEKFVFSGDVVCPVDFAFVIEVKNGYDDIDLSLCLSGSCKPFDEFLNQVSKAAELTGKEPLLCWHKTRKPWMVFSKKKITHPNALYYGVWMGCSLNEFLKQPDLLFFVTI